MPESTFERELRSFKTRLTPTEQSDFAYTTINDLYLTLASIQQTQISERTNTNVKRLRRFLEAVEPLAKVLELFVNVSDFVAFVWGPVKYLLLWYDPDFEHEKLASTYTDAFTSLLETYQTISRHLPLLTQYQALFERSSDMQEVLGSMFRNIFDFHLRALRFFQARKWKQMFKAHVFRSKFADIIEDLRQHKELVERQADLIEFQEAKQARDDAQHRYEESEAQERARRRLFLRDWLDAPNMAGQQEKGQTTREAHPQSGCWLLLRDKVKAWLDPSMSVAACLWIHGIPGAGKTILASLLVDTCKKVANTRTLYFYFRHGDPRTDNFISMARSLLDQLSSMEISIVDMLYDMAVKQETCFKTRKDTEELLQVCLDATGPLYIVIDGLDECPEAEQKVVARWLRKYADQSGSKQDSTRCVFFSQEDTTTRTLLSTLPTIQIRAADNKGDIKAYCSAMAKDIQAKFAESDSGTMFLIEAVSSKADGMFLYATLVMDNLFHQLNLAAMRAELRPDVFPNGLDQAYGRIIKRILDEHRPNHCKGTRKILAWLVCAIRPLKWREIQCAISIDPDLGSFNPDQRLAVQPKDICGSLVDHQSDGSVILVHTTAKFFLVSTSITLERPEHLKLSNLSLDQFCFAMFDDKLDANQLSLHVQAGHFAFFEYSLVNWIPHLRASLEQNDRRISPGPEECDILEFIENLSLFLDLHWMEPKKKSRATRSMVSAIKCLPQLDDSHRKQLLQTLSSAHGLTSSDVQDQTCFEASKLYKIMRTVRRATESLASNASTQADIERYYGKHVFKCPRLYCKWFHEWFASAAKRDEHVSKHERAYYCPYVGCAHATLGCKTESELELHYENYHKPSLTIDDFPPPPPPPPSRPLRSPSPSMPPPPSNAAPPRPSSPSPPPSIPTVHTPPSVTLAPNLPVTPLNAAQTSLGSTQPSSPATAKRPTPVDPAQQTIPTKRPRQTGPFNCDACPKVFQRISHLRSHQRTHTDEKPFVCASCGKRFARQPDLTRHGMLHSGDRRHTCRGSLRDGRPWGCGKKFTRADGLARHFKGTRGMLCLKPLLDEEQSLKGQPAASTSGAIPTSSAVLPVPISVPPSGSGHAGATVMDWDDALFPTSTYVSGLPTDAFEHDDFHPRILYEQHPEISSFNWDAVLPE